MSEIHTEAVPAITTFNCDRCRAQNISVDARIETMDRDFQGAVVYSHHWHLCQRCRVDWAEWMKGGRDE